MKREPGRGQLIASSVVAVLVTGLALSGIAGASRFLLQGLGLS